MKEEPGPRTEESSLEEDAYYSPPGRDSVKKKNRLLGALIGILIFTVIAAGIVYLVSRRTPARDGALQAKLAAFEEKILGLERQIADLQGKSAAPAADPQIVQRLEALTKRMEALEKPPKPAVESKTKPAPASSKGEQASPKRYHIVQKGETLTRISKKYSVPVEELRRLNRLSPDQPIKTGQKILLPSAP
jgi:LysM repeat protein